MEKGRNNGILFLFGIILIGIWYYRERFIQIAEPFGWGIVIAFLLLPIAKWLERKNISTAVSIGLIYGAFMVLFLLIGWFAIPTLFRGVESFIKSIPDIWARMQEFLKVLPIDFNEMMPYLEKMLSFTQEIDLVGIISSVTEGFTSFSIGIVLSGYFLKERRKMGEGAFELFPQRFQEEVKSATKEIAAMFGSFIRGRFLLSLCVGVLTYIMVALLGIPNRLLFSVLSGILDILPFFGPFLAGIPIVIFAFMDSIGKGIAALVGVMLIQQIENLFLQPKIMGSSVGLHPATTILAVLTGASFFGFFGMILAVPVFGATKILIKRIFSHIV